MKTLRTLKVMNDPIYGFITIPNTFIFNLIEHPYFQRLRRINQMGVSYLVYPGAQHTRFHHAIGAMHLMQQAIYVLKLKGVKITKKEQNGLLAAILLHDIGHGPFSHALEGLLLPSVSHEQISLVYMELLNKEFKGKLDTCIQIFKGEHPKKFLYELISSQLDMDRLDYLKRDSFYTGVAEGNVNSERLIKMLNVVNGELVVEQKGIYSIEQFLLSRRMMYWQVYLHKTNIVAENILVKIMQRASYLIKIGANIPCSRALKEILQLKNSTYNTLGNPSEFLSQKRMEQFSDLDDFDIISAIKEWKNHSDFILRELSRRFIYRDLFKIKMSKTPITNELKKQKARKIQKKLGVSKQDLHYFLIEDQISNQVYNKKTQKIKLLNKNDTWSYFSHQSDPFQGQFLSKKVIKYFLCYPKI